MATPSRAEVEAAFRRYLKTGAFDRDWNAWADLFTEDAYYYEVQYGTFRGRALSEVPVPALVAELRRWGVSHLLVWSEPAKAYLRSSGELAARWQTTRWQEFELLNADVRSVVTAHGDAVLEGVNPFGAQVRLTNAQRGAQVIVRTNYHPAWRARNGTALLAVSDVNGQLAFPAPADGDSIVELQYPARRWLIAVALAAVVAGWRVMRVLKF